MATRSVHHSARSPLTSRQRRELRAARKLLGDASGVHAYAVGRANARWSDGTTWVTGIFGAVFVGAFVLLHVILIPGGLVLLLLSDSIRPRRGIAVTAGGVVGLKLRTMNGSPASALAITDHGALFDPRTDTHGNKVDVRVGADAVSLRNRDLAMLRRAAAAIAQRAVPSGPGSQLPPPPPDDRAFGALPQGADDQLPRWRELTAAWLLVHLMLGLILVLGVIMSAFVVAHSLGRDVTSASPRAGLLWVSCIATVAGWLCFVYYPDSRRLRLLLLVGLVGGALVLAGAAVFLGSPISPR